MERRLAVLEQLIREYLAKTGTRSLLFVDFEYGEVEDMGDYSSVRESIEVAKEWFVDFCLTCDEATGEKPTCIDQHAVFVIGPTELEAVITFRIPHPSESAFPVMSVKQGNAVEEFTVEQLTSSSEPPAAPGPSPS